MKLMVHAVLHPRLFLLGISEDQSVIVHISAKDYDTKHGKCAAQKLLIDPKVKIRRFDCLIFNDHLDWGYSGDARDFNVNGEFLCHLMISIAANSNEGKANYSSLKALFDRQVEADHAFDWLKEVGQHVISGTQPPSNRPDLLGRLQTVLKANPNLMAVYVQSGGEA